MVAAGVLLSVSIVAVAAFLACRKKTTVVRRRVNTTKPPDDMEMSEAGFGEGFHRRSAQYRASLYAQEAASVACSRQVLGKSHLIYVHCFGIAMLRLPEVY